MLKRISNITLIVLVVVFLLSGMIRTALFPMEVNEYENRKAEKLTKITAESFLSGEWQDNMEAALADQAFFAQDMKKNYNNVLSLYLKNMTLSVADENQESYVSIGEQFLFGPETIVAGPSTFEYLTPALDKHIASYNKLFSKYPDTEFYVYYIEKDTDINFETNEKVGVAQYLAENISLPAENKSAFSINNFKEFSEAFYKTDHHWKYTGSHRGYCEILDMLLDGETPIEPETTVTLKQRYSGSKTQHPETGSFSEEFTAYTYVFPEMTITLHGSDVSDYGLQSEYVKGCDDEVSYGLFYGGDMGEIIFDTHNPQKENLLIIGDSNDNAILKLLAGHFNKLVSIDLRFYEAYMNKQFSLQECINTHSIDKVLFIGNVDYYISDDFLVEE